MKCAWNELLSILPLWLRTEVDEIGRQNGQEIRLRCGQPPLLICKDYSRALSGIVSTDDIQFLINTASQYSPWAAESMAQGYVTAPGGHRIGLCGEAVVKGGEMAGIRSVTSVCVRIARDFPGIAMPLLAFKGSVIIIGPPGSGKTTMLRDLIRQRCRIGAVSVADERGELFPPGLYRGTNVDVLSGMSKSQAIDRLLRSMSPVAIAVDEITAAEDASAILSAMGCGVDILATAHADCLDDLKRRRVYAKLMELNAFPTVVVLRRDKSCTVERVVA